MKKIKPSNNSSNTQRMEKGDSFHLDQFLPKDCLDTALKLLYGLLSQYLSKIKHENLKM